MNQYKQHWIRMKATSLMLLLFFCSATMFAEVKVEELPTKAGSTLQNGVIYKVTKNTDIINRNGPGLKVAEKAVATIYIPANIMLNVAGADASTTLGAYAGIEVPDNATLIITGAGKLTATGGRAAAGGNGSNGSNADVDVAIYGGSGTAGSGGGGGYGGGGGAAAIGGNGGNGARATEGVTGPTRETSTGSFDCKGTSGHDANEGSVGSNMGKVYVLGSVNVSATYDNTVLVASKAGNNGKTCSGSILHAYTAGGGGAGGGGGSGFFPQYGIGGGGTGGQSGASGGSGGTLCKHSGEYRNGGSGEGGYGATRGSRATNAFTTHGGAGGSAKMPQNTYGNAGTLYVSTLAQIHITNDRPDTKNAEMHEAISYKITFNANDPGAKLGTKDITACFGVLPSSIEIPTKENAFFVGYFTEAEGGEMLFDEKGNPCHEIRSLGIDKLYAHWSNTHINSVDGIIALYEDIKSGQTTNGAVYYLDNDIDISDHNDLMIGCKDYPFMGTFDGQGHTITVNYNVTNDGAALFSWVKNATIRNLIVKGDVTTNKKFASGLVACGCLGVVIDKCISYVNIHSGIKNDATCGGLIGVVFRDENKNDSRFSINNSAYLGKIYGKDSNSCGGLVGWAYDSGVITKSYVGNIFSDEAVSSNNSQAMVRCQDYNKVSIRDSYYHIAFTENNWSNEIKEAKTYTDDEQKNGTLCYSLNGNTPNGVWYQTIGEDESPSYNTDRLKVFADYSSEKPEMVYHNRDYVKLSTDAIFNTGYTPGQGTQVNIIYESKGDQYTNTGLTVISDKDNVYSYLYYNGKVLVDSLSAGTFGTYSYVIGNSPLFVRCDGKLYEMSILENGILVHHFIPAFYNNMNGFFDTVDNNFIEVPNATTFLDTKVLTCKHKYYKLERSYGKNGSHCYICNAMPDPSYYVQAVFSGEGATGIMGEQTLEPGDRLTANRYFKKLHLFSGWKVYDRNGNKIGKDLYADGEALDIDKNFCDTLTFKAQWADAFTVNGDTLLLSTDNMKDIQIIDDSHHGFGTLKEFTAEKISYTRTLPAEYRWGSLCLPFAITENETTRLYNVGKIVTDTEENHEYIALTRTSRVEAGKPCIFYDTREDISNERAITFEAKNANVVKEPSATTNDNLTFIGTFESEAFKCKNSHSYYGVMKDVFYNVGTSYVIYPYHMYMSMPDNTASAAKQMYYIRFSDGTTLVEMLNKAESDNEHSPVYDITGRRTTHIGTPGIYIINGKKIHVK